MRNNSRGIEEEFYTLPVYGFKRTSPDAPQILQKLKDEGLGENSS